MIEQLPSSELRLHEATFRAFGSNSRIVTDVQSGLREGIVRLEDLEARWSRFLPASEISQLNDSGGESRSVSAITAELIGRAEVARRKTDGRFNPLMARQLCATGYDRSYELMAVAEEDSPADGDPASSEAIELSGNEARLPRGCAFDPGGLGKGLAADLLVADLLEAGASWAVVSLGGDIRFGGAALAEATQTVLVDDPRTEATLLGSTRVAGGALATSSITGKQWRRNGRIAHHLLDPATGNSVRVDSPNSVIAASVYAPTAWWADVVAKVLIIDPAIQPGVVHDWGCEAVVFTPHDVIDFGLPVEREAQR